MSETEGEQTLAEKHREWKLKASEVLNEWATDSDHCSTYDSVVYDAGLKPRLWTQDDYDRDVIYYEDDIGRTRNDRDWDEAHVVGEDTEEGFRAWQLATVLKFREAAKLYGIYDLDAVLEAAGFPADLGKPETTKAFITATVRVPVEVEVFEGQNLIDAWQGEINRDARRQAWRAVYHKALGDQFYGHGQDTEVDWKIVTE